MKKEYTAYLLARLPIALSMFGHGLVRIPKLSKFSEGMVNNFSSKSALPVWLVQPFSLILPFAELLVGLLLFIGLFTRFSIIAGSVIILALIFGSAMLEEWNSVFTQMFYGAYFAVLLYFIQLNRYSADTVLLKK